MRGYTLIELLITITITTILMTFGINAYRKSSDIQTIKSETEIILKILSQAQKAATTGKTDCTSRYIGERVQVSANQGIMTVTSICSDDEGLPRSTSLSEMLFLENHTFTYRPLNQGVELDTPDPLNLDYSNANSTYRIEVSKSGSIKAIGKI